MAKFNLEMALAGDPVVTRDGRKVTEIHYFKSYKGDFPIYAVINNAIESYTKEGDYNIDIISEYDLFMAPKIIERWVNVYQYTDEIWLGRTIYNSEEEAKNAATDRNSKYVKTIKITNEK